MVFLNPGDVRLIESGGAAVVLEGVSAIAIDRSTERSALQWSDLGPHVVFADAPEQRVTARVWREPSAEEADAAALLRPGTAVSLSFRTSRGGSEAAARRVFTDAVVLEVRHEVGRRGATQRVALVCVSSGGADDPVQVVEGV